MTRGTDFDGEPNIDTSDFEANCGEATTVLGSDRTGASSSPSWQQKAIFGEFFEEAIYMLLGSKTTTELIEDKAYKWTFDIANEPRPLATIKNSYFANGGDTFIFDNAKMSTWEMKFSNDGVDMTYEFESDVASPNHTNPVDKNIPTTLSKLGVANFKVYVADVGSNLYDITQDLINDDFDPYECVTEGNVKFDNNLDDFTCIGQKMGKSNKDEGDFKGEGALTLKWNGSNKDVISKWLTGSSNGTDFSEDSFYVEVLIVAKGKKLGATSDTEPVDIFEEFLCYMPKVEVTKAWSPLSGNDTKTIDMEYQTVANASAPVHMKVVSAYEKLTNEP